jgi:hypothetical protein
MTSSGSKPSLSAICSMGFIRAERAISKSVTVPPYVR